MKIDDILEELMQTRAILNFSNKELTNYIREILKPLAIFPKDGATPNTFYPSIGGNKNLLIKL